MSGEAPNFERIFLQPFAGEDGGHTWCSERIENEDVEYVRVDVHEAALLAVRKEGIEEAAKVCASATRAYKKMEKQIRESGSRLRAESLASGAYASSLCERDIRQLLEVKG